MICLSRQVRQLRLRGQQPVSRCYRLKYFARRVLLTPHRSYAAQRDRPRLPEICPSERESSEDSAPAGPVSQMQPSKFSLFQACQMMTLGLHFLSSYRTQYTEGLKAKCRQPLLSPQLCQLTRPTRARPTAAMPSTC